MTYLPLYSSSTLTHTGGGLSTGAIIIAVLAGLIALACLVWALGRLRGFEPRWALDLRHSISEASVHASETLSELADWLRLGR
jgi:hypothetical protein